MAKKQPKEYIIEDTKIIDNVYPVVYNSLKTKTMALKSCVGRFIQKRHDQLYDYAPMSNIYFMQSEVDDFFRSIGVNKKVVTDTMHSLYYWNEDELQACKDEFSITCLMALRYLLKEKKNDQKLIELVATYLSFSGKFYATCYWRFWKRYNPKKEIMDYVVNYMLSQKFDLVKTKSVFGAVRNLSITWVERYKDELLGDLTDERVSYLFHQLHNRIYAFLKNIAKAYYEADEKKLYVNAESDNYEQDNYRIANNNSSIASVATEKTMIYFSTNQINISICYNVSDSGVDPYDVKAIFENILNNNQSLDELRFVINVMLMDFVSKYPEEKDITGPRFIAHSISMKPNTKDENIIRSKNIILNWLSTSDRYNNIKTQATKNNYYKAILRYIAIIVNIANK